MGFWGTFIVGRSEQSLLGYPALTEVSDAIGWHGRGSDGWQVVQVDNGPAGWDTHYPPGAWEAMLTALMEQTGHPVLAATILDSDGGQLIGYSPRAGRWGGWLQLDTIISAYDLDDFSPEYSGAGDIHDQAGYQRHLDALRQRLSAAAGPPGATAAPLAIAWAAEAGLKPDAPAVAAALDGEDAFAENLFYKLLVALGVPECA
jgi:hypothetical protein